MDVQVPRVLRESRVFQVCKEPQELQVQGEKLERTDPKAQLVSLVFQASEAKMVTLEQQEPLDQQERQDQEEQPAREESKASLDCQDPQEHQEKLVNLEIKDKLDLLDLSEPLDLRENVEPLVSAV